jgi:hypothetical protein
MTKSPQEKLSDLLALLDGHTPDDRRQLAAAWAEAYLAAARTRHDPPPGRESNPTPRNAADQTSEGSCNSDSTEGVSQ